MGKMKEREIKELNEISDFPESIPIPRPYSELFSPSSSDSELKVEKESPKEIEGQQDDFFNESALRYCQRLYNRYNTIRILGMTEPIPLLDAYVRVNILEKITSNYISSIEYLEESFDHDRRRSSSIRGTVNGIDIVRKKQNLLVLGKPGSGKTTFLKYITLDTIKNETDITPIFISLKDWSDSQTSLIDFIVEQFDICNFPNALPFVESNLYSGHFIILLDGFDEVTCKVDHAAKSIENFVEKYNRNQFIVSCRIAAFNYVFKKFTDVEMADFNGEQIETFVNNRFGTGSDKATLCWAALNDPVNLSIKELACTPLLLAMLCLTFDELMHFPSDRVDLYKEAIDILLKKWDSSRGIRRDEVYHNLSLKRKESILSSIASRAFVEWQYFIPQRDIERHISDYIKHMPDNEEEPFDQDSEVILKTIEAQHGLLVERAKGIYSFSHLTVQEYFVARNISDNHEEIKNIVNIYFLEDRWREIWLLTAGMLYKADTLLLAMRNKVSSLIKGDFLNFFKEMDENLNPTASYPKNICKLLTLFYVIDLARDNFFGKDRTVPQDKTANFFQVLDCSLSIAQRLDSIYGSTNDGPLTPIIEQAREYLEDFDIADDNNIAGNLNLDQFFDVETAQSYFIEKVNFDLIDTLYFYLKGCITILDCLDARCYVSKAMRQNLLYGLIIEPEPGLSVETSSPSWPFFSKMER